MNAILGALATQARGYAVFPTTLKKLPAIASAHPKGDPQHGKCRGECGRLGHGVYDATTDPDKLADMYAAAPWATGHGIAGGRAPHYLFGLDLDQKNGLDGVARLAELAVKHSFTVPETIRVQTPSGWHLWLSAPAGVQVPNSVGKVAPGIDGRSSGGYLIGPGSRSHKGVYRLACLPDTPLAAVPPQLLALLLPPPAQPREIRDVRPARPGKRIESVLAVLLAASEGERNNTLYWAGCRMAELIADGLISEGEAENLLQRAADRWPPGNAASTIRSALNAPVQGRRR